MPDPADTIPELPLTLQPELPLTPQPGLLEQPTTSEELASGDEAIEPMPCYIAPPLSTISTNIAFPEGALPANIAAECASVTGVVNDIRREYGWAQFDFHWSATCLCHRPLYFEEINAERYGYTVSNFFQPVISAGNSSSRSQPSPTRWPSTDRMTASTPWANTAPAIVPPAAGITFPLKVGAAIVEVGTIAGLNLLIP